MKILVFFFFSLFLFINPLCLAMPENHNSLVLIGVVVNDVKNRFIVKNKKLQKSVDKRSVFLNEFLSCVCKYVNIS